MQKDSSVYSNEERREIESLYQVANKQWRSQEGKDSLKKLIENDLYAALNTMTSQFVARLSAKLEGTGATVVRVGSIFWIAFQSEVPRSAGMVDADGIARYNLRHALALEAGIYLPPSGYEVCFVSAAHTDEMLAQAADTIASVFAG